MVESPTITKEKENQELRGKIWCLVPRRRSERERTSLWTGHQTSSRMKATVTTVLPHHPGHDTDTGAQGWHSEIHSESQIKAVN